MTDPLTGPANSQAAFAPAGLSATADVLNAQSNAAFRAVLAQQVGLPESDRPNPPGKRNNDAQNAREDDPRKRSPSMDPTAAAMADLVSPAPVTPMTAQAQAVQTGQGGPKGFATQASASASSSPASTEQPRNDRGRSGTQTGPNPGPAPGSAAGSSPASSEQAQTKSEDSGPIEGQNGSPAAGGAKAQTAASQEQPEAQSRAATTPAARTSGSSGASGSAGSGGARVGNAPAKSVEPGSSPKLARPQGSAPRFKLESQDEPPAAQFGRGLAAALRQNGGSVTLRLQPEALGELKIQMSVEPGKVGASFEVQTEQARQLLGKTMDSLRSALEARGLAVDRLDVRVVERPMEHSPPAHSGPDFGGADSGSGPGAGSHQGHGSEHPQPGSSGWARMPSGASTSEAEPIERPWMGQETGGALRIRLDALA